MRAERRPPDHRLSVRYGKFEADALGRPAVIGLVTLLLGSGLVLLRLLGYI